jgi:hypothetical protein
MIGQCNIPAHFQLQVHAQTVAAAPAFAALLETDYLTADAREAAQLNAGLGLGLLNGQRLCHRGDGLPIVNDAHDEGVSPETAGRVAVAARLALPVRSERELADRLFLGLAAALPRHKRSGDLDGQGLSRAVGPAAATSELLAVRLAAFAAKERPGWLRLAVEGVRQMPGHSGKRHGAGWCHETAIPLPPLVIAGWPD